MQDIALSLVIPTYNERDNVLPLLHELQAALAGINWEVVFVDDSRDGTDRLIAELGSRDARIRLLHRLENCGGLSGAVTEGLGQVHGEYVCVMDADLQHPTARIPAMLAAAHGGSVDIVIASRYVPGGSPGGLNGPLRHMYSRALRELSLSLFPSRLENITDPLGGYFLVRRALLDGVNLHPIGYKILLEILIRCDWRTVCQIPYTFEPRRNGTSKADMSQGVLFLRHLGLLFWDCSPLLALPRLVSRAVRLGRRRAWSPPEAKGSLPRTLS